jgi:hypothetical protein
VYETPNKGIVLEPRSLWIKEWPIGHRVSLVRVGTKKKCGLGVYIDTNGYRR